MTRPCFALTLLFGSLATTLLAVSTARCQIIITLWEAGAAQRSDRDDGATPPRDEDFYENYGDADYYDDYLYEDYDADQQANNFFRKDFLDRLLFGTDGGSTQKTGDESSGSISADAVEETSVDPEAEYADEYVYDDYDCFGDDCYDDYFDDDQYGSRYSCPLAAEPESARDGTCAEERDAEYYDYRAEHDPVYDAVMFGDEPPEPLADAAENTFDSPQAWDDYDYDSGYDYESEYYDWYATGEYAPEKSSQRADAEVGGSDTSSPYEEIYRYDEAEFEEAYEEYWYGTPSGDSKSAENQYFDGEALRKRVADVFSAEVREAAASSGAACVDLGVQARNSVLLFAADTLDRLSGTLQDASAGLTRIAGHERATETH